MNRNPFIDYPELVEYIWGSKVGEEIVLGALDSPYANENPTIIPEDPTDIENQPAKIIIRKVLIDGQLFIIIGENMYNVQGQKVQ